MAVAKMESFEVAEPQVVEGCEVTAIPEIKTHGVTSVMASQIQAFDESFTVK